MSDLKEFEKQLPPLPTLLHTRVVDGVPCISVSEHEYQMREYALQAILALQKNNFPVQVPMTREQAMAIVQSNPDTMTAIRMTEAHHGITAQCANTTKKETP